MTPVATVLVPARNEEKTLRGCLEAVAGQDTGPNSLQVIVADGRSTDRTTSIAAEFAGVGAIGELRCVDNPVLGISAGLNRSLAEAGAPIVVRIDARSRIATHYVRRVAAVLLDDPAVGVVGGAQVAVTGDGGVVARGVARALRNRWSTGMARYRRSTDSGPADTVWMGAFRAEDVRRLGGWNEQLPVNEDYELCERYRAAGFHVWFVGDLRSEYVARTTFSALARQYWTYGRVKGERWSAGGAWTPRHVALVAAPPAGAAAALAIGRRLGLLRALGVAALAALTVDAVGSQESASPEVRATACVATGTFVGAWWAGVVVGLVGGRRS